VIRVRSSIAGITLASLSAIATAQVQAQGMTARNWDATLRGFVTHDTNAPLAGHGSGFNESTSGTMFGLAANGSKDIHRAPRGWNLQGMGSVMQTYQNESALRDFDLTALTAGLTAFRHLSMMERPARMGAAYQARRDWLGGSGYQTGHTLGADLGIDITQSARAGVFANLSWNDYRDDGTQPGLTSRDSRGSVLGLRGEIGFNGNRQVLSATLRTQKINADGDNFDLDGNAAAIGFRSFLVFPWVVAVNLSRSSSEYVNYIDIPQRTASTTQLAITIAGPIARHWSADLSYSAARYGANIDDYRASRRQATLGLTYKF
jgi:hypothetical protein